MASTLPEEEVKPFSKQRNSEKEKVMKLWEDAYLSSGGDLKSVLTYYLYHTKSGKHNRIFIVDGLRRVFQEKAPKQERHLSTLLDGLSKLYNGYQTEEQRVKLLELLLPILSKSELQRRGIVITKEQWDELKKNARPLGLRQDGVDGLDDYDLDMDDESEMEQVPENQEINPVMAHGAMYHIQAAMMEEESPVQGLKRDHASQRLPIFMGPGEPEGRDEEMSDGANDDEDASRRKRRKLQ
jgi:hypothetical protein